MIWFLYTIYPILCHPMLLKYRAIGKAIQKGERFVKERSTEWILMKVTVLDIGTISGVVSILNISLCIAYCHEVNFSGLILVCYIFVDRSLPNLNIND